MAVELNPLIRVVESVLNAVVLIVAIWTTFGGSKQPSAKKWSWIAVVFAVAEAVLGGASVPLSQTMAFTHAFF